jgi:hypothetical protein
MPNVAGLRQKTPDHAKKVVRPHNGAMTDRKWRQFNDAVQAKALLARCPAAGQDLPLE